MSKNTLVTTENSEIQALLAEIGFNVRKKGITLARLPTPDEIGANFDTFTEKDSVISKETGNVLKDDSVIGRNPTPLSDGSFNEWVIPKATFLTNYGKLPESTQEYSPFVKIIGNRVIVIDEAVLNILKSDDGKSATLGISWDENGMVVSLGDYLFDAGYGVNKREYDNTYEEI